jgi:hypothetical protein
MSCLSCVTAKVELCDMVVERWYVWARKNKRLVRGGVEDTSNRTNRKDECLVKIHGRYRSVSKKLALLKAK